MKILYLELKRVLKSRITWILLALALFLSVLLSVLASVSFTLFLSTKCKTTVSSLVFCIAPVVISITAPGALGTWLCSVLPASRTSIQASVLYVMTDFQFLNLARLSVWTPYAMIGACVIEIPLFAFLAVHSYCRHALN